MWLLPAALLTGAQDPRLATPPPIADPCPVGWEREPAPDEAVETWWRRRGQDALYRVRCYGDRVDRIVEVWPYTRPRWTEAVMAFSEGYGPPTRLDDGRVLWLDGEHEIWNILSQDEGQNALIFEQALPRPYPAWHRWFYEEDYPLRLARPIAAP